MSFVWGFLLGLVLMPTIAVASGHAVYLDLFFGKAVCFFW